jgi:Uma2 family endonuclease
MPTSQTLYEQLEALPEGLTGEILNGQLHAQPRPTGPHARAETELSIDIGSAYGRGRGGPGGWWIIVEPEIHFITDVEVTVPDLAGWRKSACQDSRGSSIRGRPGLGLRGPVPIDGKQGP